MKPRKSTAKQPAQQYDITVKELLQAGPPKLLELVLGAKPAEFLTVEFPKVRLRRPDFVVRTEGGDIEQIEVQSDNDSDMEWRMLEYYPLLRKLFGRPPKQRVLYIGQSPLTMTGHLDEPDLQFRFEVIDVSDLDAEALLQSSSVEDHILALLCHADNERLKVRRILQSLHPLPAKIQGDKIEQLLVLSRLRGLTNMITQEVRRRNPLRELLSESEEFRKLVSELASKEAVQLAEKKAVQLAEKKTAKVRAEVRAETQREERIKLLTRQLEVLHGKLPKWAKEKIATANTRTLEKWAVRLLKAETLEEALR